MHKQGDTPYEKELIVRYCLLNHPKPLRGRDGNDEEGNTSGKPDRIKYQYLYLILMTPIPVDDGRHRLLWYLLAPFVANVLLPKNREGGKTLLLRYFEECGKLYNTDITEELIEYYLDYFIETGIYPPLWETLQSTDPQLAEKLIKEAKVHNVNLVN